MALQSFFRRSVADIPMITRSFSLATMYLLWYGEVGVLRGPESKTLTSSTKGMKRIARSAKGWVPVLAPTRPWVVSAALWSLYPKLISLHLNFEVALCFLCIFDSQVTPINWTTFNSRNEVSIATCFLFRYSLPNPHSRCYNPERNLREGEHHRTSSLLPQHD